MEPRINHGQPGWLGAWLQDRCHQGLEVPEARVSVHADVLQV
jgi:hypothetical protein